MSSRIFDIPKKDIVAELRKRIYEAFLGLGELEDELRPYVGNVSEHPILYSTDDDRILLLVAEWNEVFGAFQGFLSLYEDHTGEQVPEDDEIEAWYHTRLDIQKH